MEKKRGEADVFYQFRRTNLRGTERIPFTTSGRLMIGFVEKGVGYVKVGDTVCRLGTRSMLFLHPHLELSLLQSTEDFSVVLIGLETSLISLVEVRIEPTFFIFAFQHLQWYMDAELSKVARHFCLVMEYVMKEESSPYRQEVISSLLLAFLQTFYYKAQKIYKPQNQKQTLNAKGIFERFLQRLHQDYAMHHQVAYYANLLCISAKYLTQITKQIMNRTPKELIDRRVGLEALRLLTKTSLTVQEISNQLGFPDQSYFGRFFKRMFGMSPLHYRQNPETLSLDKLDY